jgi:hypothetical protein
MKWAGHVTHMVGIPEGKRPLGRPKHNWENNIRIYLREMVWKGVDNMHLAQDTSGRPL